MISSRETILDISREGEGEIIPGFPREGKRDSELILSIFGGLSQESSLSRYSGKDISGERSQNNPPKIDIIKLLSVRLDDDP